MTGVEFADAGPQRGVNSDAKEDFWWTAAGGCCSTGARQTTSQRKVIEAACWAW